MFLFITYKPDSTDYCRGCLMASYSGDHQIYNFLTPEQLVEKWAECLYRNMDLRCSWI